MCLGGLGVPEAPGAPALAPHLRGGGAPLRALGARVALAAWRGGGGQGGRVPRHVRKWHAAARHDGLGAVDPRWSADVVQSIRSLISE